ncbi:MAG: ACT domain-containing protein [Chloroflexota bacterium]
MVQQFVVHIEDRPGALSRLTHELAVRRINIHHIAGVGAGTTGHVVLTVDDEAAAREALLAAGYVFEEGQQLMVVVDDRPGALAEVSEKLARAGVNIHSFLILGTRNGRAELALTVDDIEAARKALGL